MSIHRVYASFFLVIFCLTAKAYDPNANLTMRSDEKPQELIGVGVDEKLGDKIDLNTEFVDDTGAQVKLGKYFGGKKPVLMTIIYYSCPNLCNYHLNGLSDALKEMKLKAGDDYEFVAISMDHTEKDFLASEKKANYIEKLGDASAAKGWHFLTGTEANIKKIADQVGFSFKWDEPKEMYSHTAVAYVMTPQGAISRYLYGVKFKAQTVSLSLVEASNRKIGTVMDRLVLFCFQFDPTKSKYTLYSYNIMRAGMGFVAIVLGIFLIPAWIRERKTAKGEG